jgi:YVTN family beta-propeller protein
MRSRAVTLGWLALAVLLLAVGCASSPALRTSTPTTRPATQIPKLTPSPTAMVPPSPTLPDSPQLIEEITLRALPGVGHNPQAVAVLHGRVYVANRSTNNVSVLEGDELVAAIPVGEVPVAVAADMDTGLVYVANEAENSVSFISGTRVVQTVSGPQSPACLAAWGGHLYVGGRGDNALMVLDGLSGELLDTVPLEAPIGVLALAVNPATNLLYASVYDGVQIVSLESLTVVGQLAHEVYLTLETDPIGGGFFVGEYDADSGVHYLINYTALAQEEVARVSLGGDPRGVAVDSAASRIFVANSWSNDLSIIDRESMREVARVPVGLRPLDVAIGSEGQVYVVNSGGDNVSLVDGGSGRLLGVVPLAILPRGMVVNQDTGELYIACASTDSVFVVKDRRVAAEMPAGQYPRELALSPDGQTLVVLNHVGGDLMFLSVEDGHIVSTVPVGRLPQGLAVVPGSGQLYASDTVLDAGSLQVLRNVELSTIYGSTVKPIEIQVDATTGRAYMIAFNGVPGSNGGYIVYIVDLKSGERIEGQVGGLSMTGLALDPEGQRIFSTAGRFGTFQLIVNDARTLEQIASLSLPKYPAALAYNPDTHHIFIFLTHASDPTAEPGTELWVLDSRGLGIVDKIPVSGVKEAVELDAQHLAVDSQRGYVYLSDSSQGAVGVFRDVVMPIPPTPTPTLSPTPWPTLTPVPDPTPTLSAAPQLSCEWTVGSPFGPYWSDDTGLRLGLRCPAGEAQRGPMAEQAFERGYMIWRQWDRTIFVLYEDGIWRSFSDRWTEGMPELSCRASPPDGRLQPKRGFGLVWCAENGVKEGLGWALGEERGYEGAWQVFEQGQMMSSEMRPIFLALFYDGTYREYASR